MNVYVNSAVRDCFAALETLLSQKEWAERELKVTSRWNPFRRQELKETIDNLDTQIRVINESMAATPAWAW